MLEYDLPEDWDLLTHDERLNWHANRVEKEEPVFTMLEDVGVMTCFEPEEVRVRLAIVQAERRRVESALLVAEDQEFQGLWESLKLLVAEAREDIAERARILNLQFRRKGFRATAEEAEKLAMLRTSVDGLLTDAEEVEGEIIRVCDGYGVDPSPYLIVDAVRDNK